MIDLNADNGCFLNPAPNVDYKLSQPINPPFLIHKLLGKI